VSARTPHLPSATALELLRQRAQVALETWIEEWAAGRPPLAVVAVTTAIDHAEWRGHSCHQLCDPNGGLWIRASATDQTRLLQCIFGPDREGASGELIDEIVNMAALARAEELRAALFGEASLPVAELVTQLPAELFASGSSAVQMICNSVGLRAIAYVSRSNG
jgi:hypothetical protein